MPLASIFVFLGITFFFVKFIIQSAIPLHKALNNGTKSLLYFTPTKTFSTTSNKYYISLPIPEQENIEISKETFENINENEELCIEILPEKNIILHLRKNGKELKYF